MQFNGYQTDSFFDELFATPGEPRDHARLLVDAINNLPEGELKRRQSAAEGALLRLGITFTINASSKRASSPKTSSLRANRSASNASA